MALTKTPICNFGEKAKNFNLLATENKKLTLDNIKGENGTLIMFICNHCPYVKAIIKDLTKDCENLKKEGINSVAIMSNDVENYPEDSFENMISFAKSNNFGDLNYLIDQNYLILQKRSCFQKSLLGNLQCHLTLLQLSLCHLFLNHYNLLLDL